MGFMIKMKTLTKILIAGSLIGATALGYLGKEYLDSLGKYDCVYNRQIQMKNIEGSNPMSSNQGSTGETRTINYIVSGKCDFDFDELNRRIVE